MSRCPRRTYLSACMTCYLALILRLLIPSCLFSSHLSSLLSHLLSPLPLPWAQAHSKGTSKQIRSISSPVSLKTSGLPESPFSWPPPWSFSSHWTQCSQQKWVSRRIEKKKKKKKKKHKKKKRKGEGEGEGGRERELPDHNRWEQSRCRENWGHLAKTRESTRTQRLELLWLVTVNKWIRWKDKVKCAIGYTVCVIATSSFLWVLMITWILFISLYVFATKPSATSLELTCAFEGVQVEWNVIFLHKARSFFNCFLDE